jgi:hypothetical protein
MMGISSCGSDGDGNTETEVVKGRPTVFEFNANTQDLYHYINENQLSKIVYSDVTMDIHYTGNEIAGCTFTRKPEYGGALGIDFEKVGSDRINATIRYDHFQVNYRIYLDANGLPVSYNMMIDDKERIDKEFTFLSHSNQIHQKKVYFYSTTDALPVVKTHSYEYDNHPGSTSKINCPVWFRLFFSDVSMHGVSDKELSNYYHNVVKEHITYDTPLKNEMLEYHYTYDDEGFPSSVTEPLHGLTITIKY